MGKGNSGLKDLALVVRGWVECVQGVRVDAGGMNGRGRGLGQAVWCLGWGTERMGLKRRALFEKTQRLEGFDIYFSSFFLN